jgi:predicted homoserine dehydrogenase-like protein
VSIAAKLAAPAETGPVQIGVIGAGKFGSVFRAQRRRTPGSMSSGSITITTAPQGGRALRMGQGSPKRQIRRGTRRTGGTVVLEGAIATGSVDIIR